MVLAIPRTRAATIVGSLLRTGFRQIGQESVATMRLAPSPAERARRLDGGVERRIERRPERALATSVEPQMEGDPVRGHEHGCPDLRPRVAVGGYAETLGDEGGEGVDHLLIEQRP